MKKIPTNYLIQKFVIYGYMPLSLVVPNFVLPNITSGAGLLNTQAQVLPITGMEVASKDKAEIVPEKMADKIQLSFMGGNLTTRFSYYHPGVDISIASGTNMKPIMKGKVMTATYEGGYGQTVVIDHENGLQSRYAHMSKMGVVPGEIVTEETVIGAVGSTGRSTGPHLHLEVYENGKAIDPINVLPI